MIKMDSDSRALSAQNTETYLEQLYLHNSFEKHLTSTGENTESKRKAKIDKYTHKAIASIHNLIQDLPDDRSRLDFLFARYEDLFQDLRIAQLDLRNDRKEIGNLRRVINERRTEDLRNSETRKRLEIVCKDLQVQNKSLKEETLSLHKQEEDKRMQVVDKFQKTLAEVTTIVQDNVDKNTKLQQDKMDISNRLSLSDKTVQQREQQVKCLEKQLKLQEDLGLAGVLKARVEVDDMRTAWCKEREIWQQKEKEMLKMRLEDRARINTMQMTLDGYVDKLEAVEYSSTINKEKTENYKETLCKTQSENITLLKKIKIYKERFANHTKKSEEMRNMIKMKEAETKNLVKKLEYLEKSCRKLQLDRALFLKLLQDNHIEAIGDNEASGNRLN